MSTITGATNAASHLWCQHDTLYKVHRSQNNLGPDVHTKGRT